MPDNHFVRAASLDVIGDLAREVGGVDLRQLPPFTTLIVHTMKSLYRVVTTRGTLVYVQGGAFFPEPTAAYFDGASFGGSSLRVGWIAIGLSMEFRLRERLILTSRVRAITTIQAPGTSVH